MTAHTEVVVVGGGYAGVMAANRLTQRDDVTVTLVNPRPVFAERVRLHQLAAGHHDATVDLRTVLADRVRLVVDSASRIDAPGRTVTLASGGELAYDYLVYTPGSHGTAPTVPGADAFAHPAATLEEARRLRAALATLPADAPVTVVGGGTTGVEYSAELAAAGHSVTLVGGGVLGPYLHPRGRRSVTRQLTRLGVTVLDGARVTAVAREAVQLDDGRRLPSDVTVWTAGFAVPDLAARSGLRTDALGRLRTDETLTCVDDPRIVAAGDAASPSHAPFRMSCQAALPLGAHAADTVLARLAGRRCAPLTVGLVGQCVGVGPHTATMQFASRDDTANGLVLSGRPAAWFKEFTVRSTLRQLVREARRPGAFRWRLRDRGRPRAVAARRAAPATPAETA